MKYKLTNEIKVLFGVTLYRIEALKDFSNVKKGDKGGYIQSENNLSQEGNAWVYDNAKVYENARLFGNATVFDKAKVFGNARVFGNAIVFNNAKVRENAIVFDNAKVFGDVVVYGNAIIKEQQFVMNGFCSSDLSMNLKESIRCQCNLIPFKNKVVAYKEVNNDLKSNYEKTFKYEIGKVSICDDPDLSNESCAKGLHFSNANYWNGNIENSVYLAAEIKLKDIITVQEGKIRCKKAKIIGVYNPKE